MHIFALLFEKEIDISIGFGFLIILKEFQRKNNKNILVFSSFSFLKKLHYAFCMRKRKDCISRFEMSFLKLFFIEELV